MGKTSDKAKNYFDKIPTEWNRLYSHDNWVIDRFNRYFRRGLFERFALTFQHCGDISGAKVLDIGCGTGQYSIEFARMGAAKVTGIDIAPAMTSFALQRAQEFNVQDRCDFICDDFLSHQFHETFDIVVALGFFDYIPQAHPYFQKIASLTKKRFLASFPKDSLFWGTQRKIRYYWIKKCPIYSYTYDSLQRLFRDTGFLQADIITQRRGFFGIGINSEL